MIGAALYSKFETVCELRIPMVAQFGLPVSQRDGRMFTEVSPAYI